MTLILIVIKDLKKPKSSTIGNGENNCAKLRNKWHPEIDGNSRLEETKIVVGGWGKCNYVVFLIF